MQKFHHEKSYYWVVLLVTYGESASLFTQLQMILERKKFR